MRTFVDLRTVLADCKLGDALDVKVLPDTWERTARVLWRYLPVKVIVAADGPTAFLGVLSEATTAEQRERLCLHAEHGVIVVHALAGSPAASAGLKRDDVITRVGTTDVGSHGELHKAIQKTGTGAEITLKLFRSGQELEIKVVPQPLPADIASPFPLRSR